MMSTSDSTASPCPCCGARLPPETPGGVCPRCALAGVLESREDDPETQVLSLHDIPLPGQKASWIGNYEVVKVIAHGGMGVVYKARQGGLNRLVALKLMLGGLHASDAFKRRFRHEAELAAKLHHANIVPIHEVGEHDGQPYFSMDFIDGKTLAELARGQPMPAREAAEVVRTLAQAIHYAHSQNVLHRDLKPSNVLVDAARVPHITDFGLARELDQESFLTVSGDLLGTPGYVPPEQLSADRGSVTAASDVYGLGAILYYLLTSRPPQLAGSLAETLRAVQESEPVSPMQLNPEVPVDLETICLKCLEKEPLVRYASAEDLRQDLDRWLNDLPIKARPPGPVGRLWKWLQRNPTTAALLGVILLSLCLGLLTTSWQWRHALKANRLLDVEVSRLRRTLAEGHFREGRTPDAVQILAQQIREHPHDEAAAQRLWAAVGRREWPAPAQVYYALAPVADLRWNPNGNRLLGMMQFQNQQELGGIAMLDLHSSQWLGPIRWLDRGSGDAEFSPDGKWFFTTYGGVARLWDADAREQPGSPLLTAPPKVAMAWLADGRAACTTGTNTILVWNVPLGSVPAKLIPETGSGHALTALAVSSNGKMLAAGDESGRLFAWESSNFRLLAAPAAFGTAIDSIQAAPGGEVLVICFADARAVLWSLAEGRVIKELPRPCRVQFNHAGTRLLCAEKSDVALLDPATGEEVLRWPNFTSPAGAFSSDDRLVRLTRHMNGIAWFDARSGAEAGEPSRFNWEADAIRDSPDGRWTGWALSSGEIELWTQPRVGLKSAEWIREDARWAAGGDGGWIAGGAATNITLRRSALPGKVERQIPFPNASRLAFSRAGARLAAADDSGRVAVIDTTSGSILSSFDAGADLAVICLSPDGGQVATMTRNSMFEQWEASTGQSLAPAVDLLLLSPRPTSALRNIAYSPDGSSVLAAGGDTKIQVFFTGKPELRFVLKGEGPFPEIACSKDGRHIAAASLASTVWVWDAATGKLAIPSLPHAGYVFSVDFSSDGRLLLTAAHDGRARVWDVATGKLLAIASVQPAQLYEARFAPDGRAFATSDSAGDVRVWESLSGLPLDEPLATGGKARTHVVWGSENLLACVEGGPAIIMAFRRVESPAPKWVPRFAELLCGVTTNRSPASELLQVKQMLSQQGMTNSFWGDWAAQILAR